MADLYFDCQNGISGDMSVGALIDLGGDIKKLEKTLKSINLDEEFEYKITKTKVNSVQATDFDVIIKHHHHHHRNLEDITKIINNCEMNEKAKILAKNIFNITAEAESKVHNLPLKEVHFHEVGAIDSIADVISFSVLFCDINPNNVYFSVLSEGYGSVECAHGAMNVPVPAVVEILSKYSIPIKITANEGEMITPTGASIVAALYKNNILPEKFTIKRAGSGKGKRNYPNPILRVIEIDEK